MQKTIQQQLFALQDLKYRDFHAKLVPGMDVNNIIGVRTPELRKLAKQVAKDERIGEFLAVLPHQYLDEMNLHGFIISELKDYDECLEEIERFLPYVNNWATCDLLSPKAFKQKKNRIRLEILIKIETHKHLYAETYYERLVRCHPTLDILNKPYAVLLLFECLWR